MFSTLFCQQYRKPRKKPTFGAIRYCPIATSSLPTSSSSFAIPVTSPSSSELSHPWFRAGATLFAFPSYNISSFYTLLAVEICTHVLSHSVEVCKEVCTARVLTALHKRRIIVYCLVEMQKYLSSLEHVTCLLQNDYQCTGSELHLVLSTHIMKR